MAVTLTSNRPLIIGTKRTGAHVQVCENSDQKYVLFCLAFPNSLIINRSEQGRTYTSMFPFMWPNLAMNNPFTCFNAYIWPIFQEEAYYEFNCRYSLCLTKYKIMTSVYFIFKCNNNIALTFSISRWHAQKSGHTLPLSIFMTRRGILITNFA